MRLIAYDEPNEDSTNNHVVLTANDAIAKQIACGATKGVVYSSGEEALQDFMTLHWAYHVYYDI